MKKAKAPEMLLAHVRCREDQAQSVALSVASYLRRHGVDIDESRGVEEWVVWRNHQAVVAVHHRSQPSPQLEILAKRAARVAAVAHDQHSPLFAA